MKTIRQIADEIGVSKQAVFKKIKREPLSTSLQGLTATVDGRLMVEVDGEKLIDVYKRQGHAPPPCGLRACGNGAEPGPLNAGINETGVKAAGI